jgi:RNA polymerase sigma factor (sigma-70 family)
MKYNEIIDQYQPLIKKTRVYLYKKYYRRRDKEEIDQIIDTATWLAVKKLNEVGKYNFSTYFKNSIRFLVSGRGMYALPKELPQQLKSDVELTKFSEIDDAEQINYVLGTLTDIQRQVIDLRFYQDKTLQESGSMLGLTGERVRQIESEALLKMKRELS